MNFRFVEGWKAVAVVTVVLLLLLAACGANDDDMAETTAAAGGEFEQIGEDLAFPGDDGGGLNDVGAGADRPEAPETLGTGGIEPALLQTRSLGRDIIFTADITVAVTDVAVAGAEATAIIEELGGYLFGQQTTGQPEPRSVLTFKVLPGDFQQALARLGSIGEIRTQNVTADDVTEKVVDLESRISTAEASVERLKGFLEEANDIVTIAELESQLLQRETDLETMRGSLRTLQDRVDLATIYLTLTEALSAPDLHLEVTGFPGPDGGVSCPAEGRIQVEENEEATVCFEIFNNGDTPLAGFELRDAVLDVELGDLIVVWGDPQGILEPGQSMVLAHEITVERNQRTQTRVSAVPVDQDGNRVEGREVAGTVSMGIDAVDPGGLPGFTDGLQASWEALLAIGGLVILFAGAVLPFIWLIPLLWLAWRWRQRRIAEYEAQGTSPATPPWVEAAESEQEPEEVVEESDVAEPEVEQGE
jgi:hypothetical protein